MGRTTVGRVPAGDRGGSTNIWERREILEDVVTLGQEAVGSIGTCNRGKRLCAHIINGVPRDGCGADGERSSKESDDGGESHVRDCTKARILFAWVSGTTTSPGFIGFKS